MTPTIVPDASGSKNCTYYMNPRLHPTLMSAFVFTMTVAFAGSVLAEPAATTPAPSTPISSEPMATEEKESTKPTEAKANKGMNKMKKGNKGKKAKAQKPAVE